MENDSIEGFPPKYSLIYKNKWIQWHEVKQNCNRIGLQWTLETSRIVLLNMLNTFAVLFPAVWDAPIRGVPTGPKVFLDFARRVWAAALRTDPF